MMGLQQAVAAESVFSALRADADWLASAASAEQRAVLEPRAVTSEEFGRARDKTLEAHASLHRQRAGDQRRAELGDLKRRI
jgi:hypothetical protein